MLTFIISWLFVSHVNGLAPTVKRLQGIRVDRVNREDASTSMLDLGEWVETSPCKSLIVFSTYAADFNNIEYSQRLSYYSDKLSELGVERQAIIVNAEPDACVKLAELLELSSSVDLLSDPDGAAGRAFGVSRGWMPDDDKLEIFSISIPLSPYGKLFGMLWGLGAWATLPAVIGGYLGNPFSAQPWIESAFKQNNKAGRWPETNSDQFKQIPLVGEWGRRPLELATLRLQNMLGVSIKYWNDLRPSDDHLDLLTQLGGCCLFDSKAKSVIYEWRDPGICAVCNFEDILAALSPPSLTTSSE
uniref:Alkyl hydroperoxide reductase subunit C/ Thiol specific antioxidant domain-containing protein n=1 Tax=Aureoumbra lagunensis TaxID=44058 RepID=A0A7S3JWJ4_9STRA|mmetsp:Transcript_2636/g.3579  ORF Transcript_2636/g.3579 Transcript_2636/m.3579 type:complete len:302 (-) Transcript_2636:44-949(-)